MLLALLTIIFSYIFHETFFRADGDFQTADDGPLAHHFATRTGAFSATIQPVFLALFGWAVSFTLSLFGSGPGAVKRREAEWAEPTIYLVALFCWLVGHYTLHGSVLLALLPHMAFGTFFSAITQLNHIQEEATPAVLLDAPLPKSFVAAQCAACLDSAHDSLAFSIATIFLNFQTCHHLLPGVSHHHFLWNPAVRKAVYDYLVEQGLQLQIVPPAQLLKGYVSWTWRVGRDAVARTKAGKNSRAASESAAVAKGAKAAAKKKSPKVRSD